MTASISEQIAKKRAAAEKKAAEAAAIKKEIRKLEQRQAAAERKARTHRLVEVGAIFEQATGLTFDTEDSRAILSEVLNQRLRYNDGSTSTRGEDIAAALRQQAGRGPATVNVKLYYAPERDTAGRPRNLLRRRKVRRVRSPRQDRELLHQGRRQRSDHHGILGRLP